MPCPWSQRLETYPKKTRVHGSPALQALYLILLVPLAAARPQLEGFGDATDQEVAEIRAGTYLETFNVGAGGSVGQTLARVSTRLAHLTHLYLCFLFGF